MAQRRTGIIAFVFCICLWLLPLSVLAASTTSAVEPIDTQAECKLNVLCICYGDPYQEAPVKIYKIASVSSDFQYTLTEDFALTNLEVNGIKSDSEWRVIRSTIENYIASKNITHLSVSDTDSTGKATFVNLTPGLYLVTVGRAPYGIDCEFDSALVFLPHLSGEGLWEYEVTTSPKYEILPPITPDSKTEYKVLKLWKGDDEKDRPESVKVEIFKNGTSYKTVTLSAENNWSYTWSTKEYGVKWTVTEKDIPIEYVMTLSKSGDTFVITNSYIPNIPAITDPPSDYTPEESSSSYESSETSVTESSTPPELPTDAPQTGDTSNILLYIILMNISGIILIILGITGKRNKDEK